MLSLPNPLSKANSTMITVRYLLLSHPHQVFTIDMAASGAIYLLKAHLVKHHFGTDVPDEVLLLLYFSKISGVWLNPTGDNRARYEEYLAGVETNLPRLSTVAMYRTIAECIESSEGALDVHFVIKRRENPDDLIETASRVISHYIESSIQHGAAV